ncbi:sulfatase family protein [Aestuariibaculum sediminum]|uniref:Arylsulfatase n=1 Tax=Aestuariibaculum sediminum TaxID=2770637 RepID=A0A8J6UD27_9FLAO|nr:arylsulfatase [Aestuariibaculum sediminum]MBD0832589.1 arylsulfatase [Aestuariibaculum sediminum]
MKKTLQTLLIITIGLFIQAFSAQQKPNVIFILADDLGYGDLSCYGATKLYTPNIDKLAKQGVKFTNAHTTSATCTPSRYAIITGQYPWRKSGTGVLPGNAALIIPEDKPNLPKIFKDAGYNTGIVGKWHLGIGDAVDKDWNSKLVGTPNDVGFDYSYIFPATADRVPTVFVEDHHVVGLNPEDPIQVDYKKKVGNDPTGLENPELLKMKASPNHGHNNTIVNGIGRIGYMSGGHTARWTDEEVPFTFLYKANEFIEKNKEEPFFLFYALTEPHVPRMPSTMFKGKSGLGFRGDAILQVDWAVGEIMKQLQYLGISENTIIVFSSDNGPVLDDGYVDGAVTELNGHTPWGALRGGKYSTFEAGTRVPTIVSWPGTIKPKVSNALVSQVDMAGSFAKLLGVAFQSDYEDSMDLSDVLLGKSNRGRTYIVEQGTGSRLAIRDKNWKYIEPNNGPEMNKLTNIELGNLAKPQLYNLKEDAGETINLADSNQKKVKELKSKLEAIKNKNPL